LNGEVMIQLVDELGNPSGMCEKLAAHRNGGRLHRAVSVVLLNSKGQFLLQRRAEVKYHFGGLWANACCTHPQGLETPYEAAVRAMRHELRAEASIREVATMTYSAQDPKSGLWEREFDHIFLGECESEPDPNPEEVDVVRWIEIQQLSEALQTSDRSQFVPWLPEILRTLEATPTASNWDSDLRAVATLAV